MAPNPVSVWTLANQSKLERMIYAIDQLRFAARRAGDELNNTGDWGGLDKPVDKARREVANAAFEIRMENPPPNAEMARELTNFLGCVEHFNNPDDYNDWVATWARAMTQWDAFFTTLKRITGQS